MGKITRPILPEVYPRKRLFEALDKLRRQPMIWISGPGGCGKTTLVSSYLEDRKIPCLWYQVEEGDKDPATFFYYLGQAAQKAFPRRKTRLPLFTPEYSRGLATFSLNCFEKLFNWVKIPSVLVFDNFHEAPEESPLPEILLNALSRILEGANLLVLSRKDPPESLIRLRANHQMGILGWDELRLSFGETGGIARLHDPELRSTETLQKFHIESDGWAAGLVLMVEGGKKVKGEINGLKRLSREDIFAYFAAEILQKTGPEIQDFLLKASLSPKMTVKMAEELTGNSTAGRILSRLNRDNYFTEKRIQEEAIYQFHPLFREFLLSRAEKLFSKEEAGDTKRRAAKILEENRQYEAAISLFQDLKDWEGMLGLTARQATPMLAQGRHLLLREWLQAIPERLLEITPGIYSGWGPPTLGLSRKTPVRISQKPWRSLKAVGKSPEWYGPFHSWCTPSSMRPMILSRSILSSPYSRNLPGSSRNFLPKRLNLALPTLIFRRCFSAGLTARRRSTGLIAPLNWLKSPQI